MSSRTNVWFNTIRIIFEMICVGVVWVRKSNNRCSTFDAIVSPYGNADCNVLAGIRAGFDNVVLTQSNVFRCISSSLQKHNCLSNQLIGQKNIKAKRLQYHFYSDFFFLNWDIWANEIKSNYLRITSYVDINIFI